MTHLLELPAEIRAIVITHATSFLPSIWTHPGCLLDKSGEYFDYRGNGRDKWTKLSKCPSLLLLCFSLYKESLPTIYSNRIIQLVPELLSPSLLIDRPGLSYVRNINFFVDACFPKGCVSYPELFPAHMAADVKICLPNVRNIGLSIRDDGDRDTSLPTHTLERFLGDPSWSSSIKRISLNIEGRNRYALQAFLQSSRISDPRTLSATQRRTSILSVPFALVHLPELEELTIVMVTSLSAPGQSSSDPDPILMQGSNPRNGKMEKYTPSDFMIRNRQNQDFVIALKVNELFHAAGKNVRVLVKRCVWTEGFGGYVVEEKSLQQYNRERWESSTEFVSDYHWRGKERVS